MKQELIEVFNELPIKTIVKASIVFDIAVVIVAIITL